MKIEQFVVWNWLQESLIFDLSLLKDVGEKEGKRALVTSAENKLTIFTSECAVNV